MEDSAREIMMGFAMRTGLEPVAEPSQRYLWTDAFAVCNFLGLYRQEGDSEALQLALRLVDETHRVLGRHRPDDPRRGWISGLDEKEALQHPTVGGLRIGKELPERPLGEVYDPDLEWNRDGQYFHYLTRWMQALDRVTCVTRDPTHRRWAIELARSAHAHFTVHDADNRPIGLHWKMSTDLSRPSMTSMGQHDPLDGFITYQRLQAGHEAPLGDDLRGEIREIAQLCAGREWYTEDLLGLGSLLTDAYALARMMADGVSSEPELLQTLVETALAGLETVLRSRQLELRPEVRLPFRELGFGIGLRAARRLHERFDGDPNACPKIDEARSSIERLAGHEDLATSIERFWLHPENRRAAQWNRHREINEVMLATSLAPYGYLEI